MIIIDYKVLTRKSNNRILGGQILEKYFEYKKHSFKRGNSGTTTFFMAYIMFLNHYIIGRICWTRKVSDFGAVYTEQFSTLACFIMALKLGWTCARNGN